MLEFVSNNILLVLTIVGLIISFLTSFTGLVFKQKPVFVLAALAIMGFVTAIAYQIYDYNLKQEVQRKAEMEKHAEKVAREARKNIIDEINLTVKQTKVTVDAIAEQLGDIPLQEAAHELTSIRPADTVQFEETMTYAKGSPRMWDKYADWLLSIDSDKAAPSLSLLINSEHKYHSGLLLAYILTGASNRNEISRVVRSFNKWETFPAEKNFFKVFFSKQARIQWILFFDGTTQKPVAYAPAKEFARELMLYHNTKQHRRINKLLNNSGPDTIEKLQKTFLSIKTDVFDKKTPSELVRIMIERQLSVSVTSEQDKIYVAELVQMIQLAAANE